jgi:hypothetical protein
LSADYDEISFLLCGPLYLQIAVGMGRSLRLEAEENNPGFSF